MVTKLCGQMLPGDAAAFVKLAKETFPDASKMAPDDAAIAQGFQFCDGKGGFDLSKMGDSGGTTSSSGGNPPPTNAGDSPFSSGIDIGGMMNDFMNNDMDKLVKGGMCLKPEQAKEIRTSFAPLKCLANTDGTSCDADPTCAWAEMICIPKDAAKTMQTAMDANRGIGIGDKVMKCVAAGNDQAECGRLGSDCSFVNAMNQCLDAKSAGMANAAMTCMNFGREQCRAAKGCTYITTTMPGMPPGMGDIKSCLDTDTATLMRKAAGAIDDADDARDEASSQATATAGGASTPNTPTMPPAPKLPPPPEWGCRALKRISDCDADTTCTWLSGYCVNEHVAAKYACNVHDEGSCRLDSKCSWANFGATRGTMQMMCQSKNDAQMIAKAAEDFKAGSEDLMNLGATVLAAATTLVGQMDSGDFTGFDKLTGKDFKAVIGQISDQVKTGNKIAKEGAKKMLDKIKSADGGWGAIKDWGADKIAEAGSLLDGLDVNDIAAVTGATFEEAISDFGAVHSWAKDQARGLADKVKKTLSGGMASFTAATMAKAKGFLSGLDAKDLADIPPVEFKKGIRSIAESCKKLGAFAQDQIDAMKKQVKDSYADAMKDTTSFTADVVDEIGELMGVLDVADLKKLGKNVCKKIKRAAVKMMGGKKAAEAFTADKLAEFSDEAKAAFNGNDLKAIADLGAEGLAKLKAVVCKDDATKGLTCPGAICDFVVDHDGVKKDAEILAQFKNRFARLTGVTGLNIIQSATPKSTATRRRLGVSGRTSE
jgi:hypothetical protein